jgi:acyl-CoA-binding protein
MMLRFYGLYKQATLGKCTEPKPSFWAVIAKAKWDAWKSHGNMPKEEAMKKYVEGLKEVGESPAITRVLIKISLLYTCNNQLSPFSSSSYFVLLFHFC